MPSPVSTITPIDGSSRATSNAWESSNSVRGRNALRTSGRQIVILAMPSAVSYRMSLCSPDATHATAPDAMTIDS